MSERKHKCPLWTSKQVCLLIINGIIALSLVLFLSIYADASELISPSSAYAATYAFFTTENLHDAGIGVTIALLSGFGSALYASAYAGVKEVRDIATQMIGGVLLGLFGGVAAYEYAYSALQGKFSPFAIIGVISLIISISGSVIVAYISKLVRSKIGSAGDTISNPPSDKDSDKKGN